jgi:hypothetical protein
MTFFFKNSAFIVRDLTFSFAIVDLPPMLTFPKSFAVEKIIILCYNMHNYERLNVRVAPLLKWHICHIIIDFLGPLVFA